MKRMNKKLLSVLGALAFAILISSCGSDDKNNSAPAGDATPKGVTIPIACSAGFYKLTVQGPNTNQTNLKIWNIAENKVEMDLTFENDCRAQGDLKNSCCTFSRDDKSLFVCRILTPDQGYKTVRGKKSTEREAYEDGTVQTRDYYQIEFPFYTETEKRYSFPIETCSGI